MATPAVPAPANFKKSLRVNFTGKTRHPTRDGEGAPGPHGALRSGPCPLRRGRAALRRAAVQNASAWSRPTAGDRRRSPHVVLPRRGRGFVREIPFRCEFCPNRSCGAANVKDDHRKLVIENVLGPLYRTILSQTRVTSLFTERLSRGLLRNSHPRSCMNWPCGVPESPVSWRRRQGAEHNI